MSWVIGLIAVGGLGGRLLALRGLAWIHDPRWRLEPAPPSARSSTRVSVCVPARNEAANILTLLGSLVAQDHDDFEVIVVDDGSEDGTGDLVEQVAARHPQVRLLRAPPLPEGWTGKNHALHVAVAASVGEVLLFVDADTEHHPGAVRTVAVAMDRGLDVLVVLSGQRVPTLWEQVVNPFFWGFLLSLVNPVAAEDPKRPDDAMGNGQFAAFRRGPYLTVGGHGAVRDRIIEDVALVRVLTRAGARYALRVGPNLTQTRMYRSLGDIWRGFSKNAAFVDQAHRLRDFFLTTTAVALMAQAELWPLVGIWLGGWVTLAAAIQLGLVWWGRSLLYRKIVVDPVGTGVLLLQPLGALIGCAIVVNSLRLGLFGGGARWKGRSVAGPSV